MSDFRALDSSSAFARHPVTVHTRELTDDFQRSISLSCWEVYVFRGLPKRQSWTRFLCLSKLGPGRVFCERGFHIFHMGMLYWAACFAGRRFLRSA